MLTRLGTSLCLETEAPRTKMSVFKQLLRGNQASGNDTLEWRIGAEGIKPGASCLCG